ncbi:MAG: hypothetical protein C4576_17385 [Desulfobacteraceae bacterium]|nr:MAG: hypothetical protein C4576_17385 [Desulfobacteraceae bacterium]
MRISRRDAEARRKENIEPPRREGREEEQEMKRKIWVFDCGVPQAKTQIGFALRGTTFVFSPAPWEG